MPKEYFGLGTLFKLKDVFRTEKPKNIFLVTGQKSYNNSSFKHEVEELLSDYNVIHFNDFSVNPKIEDVKRGIDLYKESNCDLVIALGGGSPIDMAKGINVLAAQESEPEKYITKELKLERKGKPFVAIPTTAGTGSEATHFAVVYIDGTKYSLADKKLILPDYSIVDPTLTLRLPKEITAFTAMDAFSQALESYWSVGSTLESRNFASEAISLIIKYAPGAVNSPGYGNRINMSKAANLAGKAINITKTTACHAISYPIALRFNLPHGHAVALTLGEMIKHNSEVNEEDCNDESVSQVHVKMSGIFNLLGVEDAESASSKVNKLMDDIGLNRKLSTTDEDIEYIISNVNTERMGNNPRDVTKEAIREILKKVR